MMRTALVTGSARGIGQAVADHFRQRGLRVLAPSRQECDLSSPASIDAFVAAMADQPIDVLVNNAGINPLDEIESITAENWAQTLQVNLTAPFQLLQAFAPGMRARGWGRVVNVSSIFSVVSRPGRGAYSAAKAGLNGITRTAAVELGAHGILVNSVCPGYVATELTCRNNSPEALDEIAARIPVPRLAQPHEIAAVVGFLASEENTYLTGQTVPVDGGFTCL